MKYAIIILIIVTCFACQSKQDFSPLKTASANTLLAKWKLQTFENNKAVPYDAYIEITKNTQSENLYTINGRGPVNFFWANCEIDLLNNTLKMGNLNGTLIAVKSTDESLETDLLNRMAESSIFELSADAQTLIFYNTIKTKSLTFKHN